MSGANSGLYLRPPCAVMTGNPRSSQMLSLPPGAPIRFLTSPPASSGAGKPAPMSAGRGRRTRYFNVGRTELGADQFELPGSREPKPVQGLWKEGSRTVPSAFTAARNMLLRSGYVYGTFAPPVKGP